MLSAGDHVAGYRIERLLGRGGMGVVYEATQLSLDRTVALKVLTPEVSTDGAFRARFRREGRIQARIDHSNIITVHEAGEAEDGLFLAMRYVSGPTLKAMIVERELSPDRALRILEQVADALDAAHAAGLVHRDVKPQNILVGSEDHAYLADFGLTKSSAETAITESGNFIGTLDYIAPEQIRGDAATPQTDIYSFGGLLYECLTGKVPFPQNSQAAVIYAHMMADPPKPSASRPDLPAELDAVVERAMAKDPDERYRTLAEVMHDARAAFSGAHAAAATRPAPLTRAQDAGLRADENTVPTVEASVEAERPAARRVGRPMIAGALLGVIALGVLGGVLVGSAGSQPEPTRAKSHSFVAAGRLSLSPPGVWTRGSSARIDGLKLEDAVTLTPRAGGESGGLEIGTSSATGTPLLPDAFVRAVKPLPAPEVVRLGRYEGYRFDSLMTPHRSRRLRVYAIPTNHGVATAVCFSPPTRASAFMRSCGHAVETIRISGGRVYPVGPDRAFGARVNAVLKSVASERTRLSRSLAAAKTPRAQAATAQQIALLHGRASRTLARSAVGPELQPPRDSIAAALSREASAYRALGVAARRVNHRRYMASSRAVVRADRQVRAAVGRLRRAGYRIPSH